MAKPAPGANVVTVGGIALSVSIEACTLAGSVTCARLNRTPVMNGPSRVVFRSCSRLVLIAFWIAPEGRAAAAPGRLAALFADAGDRDNLG